MVIVARANPERRNAAWFRGQRPVFRISAHRLTRVDSPTRVMVG
jgi:hypothetical protein